MMKKFFSRTHLVCLILLAICVITRCTEADTVQYTYDDAGRLIAANYGDKVITYQYDKAGNLLERKITDIIIPVPGINANNSDGPVTISAGDQLRIAISLDPGSYTGTSADWYIAVYSPSGWLSFDLSQMDFSTSGLSALLQNVGLFSLDSTELSSTSSLSVGIYTYYFAVDLSGQFYYDSVTVTVDEVEVSAPTGFTASVSGSTLTLSWSAVSGADGFYVYYGYSSGNYAGSIDLGNTTSLTYSGLPDGTYYIAVTAYLGTDESGYSNEASVTVE